MKGVIQRFIVDHTKSDLFERVDFKWTFCVVFVLTTVLVKKKLRAKA